MSLYFAPEFPTLILNEDFVLREHLPSDALDFYEYYTNPQVAQYILAHNPSNLDEAEAEILYCRNLFRFKRGIYWSLARVSDNKMIGAIGITINTLNRRGEIHYDLAEAYWNKGLTTLGIQHCVRYAFDTMKLCRIEAITLPENQASQKVLIKSHFQREGTLRAYKFFNDHPVDIEMFSVIPSDLPTEVASHGHP